METKSCAVYVILEYDANGEKISFSAVWMEYPDWKKEQNSYSKMWLYNAASYN